MQQVFELVNIVLESDRETRRRALTVRGYRVLPLSTQAGVLEFVGKTTTILNWLGTAHPKFVIQYLDLDGNVMLPHFFA